MQRRFSMCPVTLCCTDKLYHHLLYGSSGLHSIRERGLLPLSSLPDHPSYQRDMGFYRMIYAQLAEPLLKKPNANSGIFLTPIDFRQLPATRLAGLPRIAVPLSALDPAPGRHWDRRGLD